jgi:hypothetical protein
MDYDALKDEAKHGSHYWCPTCREMKKPSSSKAVSSPITPVNATVPKSSYCSLCDSVELEFGLTEEYDICFSSSLYLNDDDDKYLSSLPAEEKEKILVDRFLILKEIYDANRELKYLHNNDFIEDPKVIAAKIVGTAQRHVSGTKGRKKSKTKRPSSIQRPAALKVQDGWEVMENDSVEEYEDYFTLQKDEYDNILSERCSRYIHGVQQKLGMKLDSHCMEFSEINIFCLLMSRVNDYIIEFMNEGLNSKGLPPTSAQEFRKFIGTLLLSSAFWMSVKMHGIT